MGSAQSTHYKFSCSQWEEESMAIDAMRDPGDHMLVGQETLKRVGLHSE